MTKIPKYKTTIYKIMLTSTYEKGQVFQRKLSRALSELSEDPEGIKKVTIYRDNEPIILQTES